MRPPALLSMLVAGLLIGPPLASAADTILDRWVEVNTGRPYRELVVAQMPAAGLAFIDLWCFENATAQVQLLAVGISEPAACLPGTSVALSFPVEQGPLALLVTGEGTGILAGPGIFRVLVETEAS